MRSRSLFAVAALALSTALLVAPAASAAPTIPTLASTPEYKAFVAFVVKLESKKHKPASAATKAGYTSRLEAKHTDALNRSTGLFNQGRTAAKNFTQTKFKAQASGVRAQEAQDIADLNDQYSQKLDAAAQGYSSDLDALDARYDARLSRFHKTIQSLRVKKAKAKTATRKNQIQDKINTVIQQVVDAERNRGNDEADLKSAYLKRKSALQAAKTDDVGAVRDSAQKTVDTLRTHWNKVFNAKSRHLQAKRTTQRADLAKKLNRGRVAIAQMPDRP